MEALKVEKKSFWPDAMKGALTYIAQAIFGVVLMVKGQFMLGGFLMLIPIMHILTLVFKHQALKKVVTVKTSDDVSTKALPALVDAVHMKTVIYAELALTAIQGVVAIYLMVAQKRFLVGTGVAVIPVLNIIAAIVLALQKTR